MRMSFRECLAQWNCLIIRENPKGQPVWPGRFLELLSKTQPGSRPMPAKGAPP